MSKELRIPASELQDVNTVTQDNIRRFKELGLDIHKNEVERLEDDPDNQERVLTIKTTKYFT
jgi:hypothetical protein